MNKYGKFIKKQFCFKIIYKIDTENISTVLTIHTCKIRWNQTSKTASSSKAMLPTNSYVLKEIQSNIYAQTHNAKTQ